LKKNLYILCILLIASYGYGNAIYEILNISNNSKFLSLSGGGLSLSGNLSNNPASEKVSKKETFNISLLSYPEAIYSTHINYTKNISKYMITFNFVNLNYGDLRENGINIGQSNENFISIAAKGHFKKLISYGSQLGFVHSKIGSYNSSAITADLGIRFHMISKSFGIGMAIKNIGYQINSYSNINENLPSSIKVGLHYKPSKLPAILIYDRSYFINTKYIINVVGIIYTLGDFSFLFSASDNYNDLKMNNYKNDILAGIGCGLGFKLSKGEIILGYKSHGIAGDIIGITIKKYF